MIETTNLQLLICTRQHVTALLRSKAELAALLQVTVPTSWPHFPEAFSLAADEDGRSEQTTIAWPGYFFLDKQESTLVGNGGFKGAPDEAGIVEIGYEIATEYWNRGLATEAVQGLLAYAFAHEQVQAVIAHTLAETNASNRVLQKVGMHKTAELDDPDVGKVWRWQIHRDERRTQ